MSPHHVAQEPGGDDATDGGARSEERLAREYRQDGADNSNGWQNSDINLRMAKKPEQVLPQQRGTAGMRLQPVANNQSRRDEKTRARSAIQDQKNGSRKQSRKAQQSDHRRYKPSPCAERHARPRHPPDAQLQRR